MDPPVQEEYVAFLEKGRLFEKLVAKAAAEKQNILILTHYGPDGLCASSMLLNHVQRHSGHAQVRAIGQPTKREIAKVRDSKFDVVFFVDFGVGLSKLLTENFGDRWLAIDHHELVDEDRDNERLLNPFQFGIDGATDASSSTICYFLTEQSRMSQSGFLAIVGSLSDEQDQGQRRSLRGLNAMILENDASTLKTIDTVVDLLFYGRESLPVHESIAATTTCYIPGLTANKDACLASLRGAGVDLKSATRWRTISDLTEEEKQKVLEAIVPHLQGTSISVNELVGSTYLLNAEDEYSPMRNARDFASILNCFGRLGRPSAGIGLCLRSGEPHSEISEALGEFRMSLIRTIQLLLTNEERVVEKGNYIMFVGDGVVGDRLAGSCCRAMSMMTRTRNKPVLLRTTTIEGEVKVSARQKAEYGPSHNLGLVFLSLAKTVGGTGGGFPNSAGARFSIANQQEFQMGVETILQNQKSEPKLS